LSCTIKIGIYKSCERKKSAVHIAGLFIPLHLFNVLKIENSTDFTFIE